MSTLFKRCAVVFLMLFSSSAFSETTQLAVIDVFGIRLAPSGGVGASGGAGQEIHLDEAAPIDSNDFDICSQLRARNLTLQCSSESGKESEPLSFERYMASYEAGSALYKYFEWGRNPDTLPEARDKFLATLVNYEMKIQEGYSFDSLQGELVEGMATACVIQASAPFAFFECRSAFVKLLSEVSSVNDVIRNNIIDRALANAGVRPEYDIATSLDVKLISVGSTFRFPSSSLERHLNYLIREGNCERWRNAMAAYGCPA